VEVSSAVVEDGILDSKKGGSMLWQAHHEFKDGHTEFKSQRDIQINGDQQGWIKETVAEYPLPEGARWVVGNEQWEHFVFQKEVV
jgi:hypothetical protein